MPARFHLWVATRHEHLLQCSQCFHLWVVHCMNNATHASPVFILGGPRHEHLGYTCLARVNLWWSTALNIILTHASSGHLEVVHCYEHYCYHMPRQCSSWVSPLHEHYAPPRWLASVHLWVSNAMKICYTC